MGDYWRLWETIGENGRLQETMGDYTRLWETTGGYIPVTKVYAKQKILYFKGDLVSLTVGEAILFLPKMQF